MQGRQIDNLKMVNSESLRVADQLNRAFSGDAWHGPPVRELLARIDAGGASARPMAGAHSIWELVLHIDIYTLGAIEALRGIPLPRWYGTGQDWPAPVHVSDDDWKQAKARLFQNAEHLASAIRELPDDRLFATVPGRDPQRVTSRSYLRRK